MGLLGEPLPDQSSGQLALHQPLGGEIAIKTPEYQGTFAESVPARLFGPYELLHERGQRALEPGLEFANRHGAAPRYPVQHRARTPRRLWRRSSSPPSWRAPGSPR